MVGCMLSICYRPIVLISKPSDSHTFTTKASVMISYDFQTVETVLTTIEDLNLFYAYYHRHCSI